MMMKRLCYADVADYSRHFSRPLFLNIEYYDITRRCTASAQNGRLAHALVISLRRPARAYFVLEDD